MGSQFKNNFAASSQVETPHRRKSRLLSVAARAVRQPEVPLADGFFIPAKKRLAIARERAKSMLRRFERLKKYHRSAKAAQIIGTSLVSLWRWKKAFAARGLAGLLPATARCGRHSPFENLRFTKEALRELELCFVETSFQPARGVAEIRQMLAIVPAAGCPRGAAQGQRCLHRLPAPWPR